MQLRNGDTAKTVYKIMQRPTLGKTEFVVQAVSDITCLQR